MSGPDSSFAKSITWTEQQNGNGSGSSNGTSELRPLTRSPSYAVQFWKFKLRDDDDDEDVLVPSFHPFYLRFTLLASTDILHNMEGLRCLEESFGTCYNLLGKVL